MERVQYNGAHRAWFGSGGVRPCSVLLVGEAGLRGSKPQHALHYHPRGSSGDRLRQILGLDCAAYLNLWRTDLCCDRWSTPAARERAHELLHDPDPPWTTVVLLGHKVAAACLYPHGFFTAAHATVRVDEVEYAADPNYVQTVGLGEFRAVSLPHPSGLSRVWNEPRSVEIARMIMRTVAPGIAWGSL